MTETLSSDLLAALDILAMERVDEGIFRIFSTAPQWLNGLYPDAANQVELNPVEYFPLLEVFLFDADDFWQQDKSGKLKSGPWTETDPDGNECNLEATALSLGARRILLIERLGDDYQEKQSLLQRLRENSLNQTKLVKEIRAEIITNVRTTELTGQTLNDRYKLETILGKGGLGIVYKSTDLTTDKIVAVKLLLDTAQADLYNQQLFEREIKVLKRVNHPNVVGILDSGISPTGQPYLVMDFIEGRSLDSLIEEDPVWTLGRTLNLLSHLCPGLEAIHQQKIVHRDLKPANIIIKNVDGREVAVLLDLGIAKMVRGSTEHSLIKTITETGVVIGTVQYLSPEQCRGAELDERTDIYSLGIMIYEILAGMSPFITDSLQGWLIAHMQMPPMPLRRVNPLVPSEIETVVMQTLAKNRDDRPASVMEFLDNFRAAAIKAEPRLADTNHQDEPTIYFASTDKNGPES